MVKTKHLFSLVGMLAVIFVSNSAHAFTLPDFVHADGFFGVSYTNANVVKLVGKSSASTPFLMQFNLGATVAYRYSGFLAGITSDVRVDHQMSEVKTTTGNTSGTRWNYVSPTLGYRNQMFIIKGDFQFLGNYLLGAKTKSKEEVMYKDPLGGRITYLHNLEPFIKFPIHAGAQVEYMQFSTLNISKDGTDTLKELALATPLKLWQFGIVAAYAL